MTYLEFSHLYHAGAIAPTETMLVTHRFSWGTMKKLESAWIILWDETVTEVDFVYGIVDGYEISEERNFLARNLPAFFWAEEIYGRE